MSTIIIPLNTYVHYLVLMQFVNTIQYIPNVHYMRYTGKDTQFLSLEQQRISAHKPAVTLPFKNQPNARYVLH
jgi:hypothetical protein